MNKNISVKNLDKNLTDYEIIKDIIDLVEFEQAINEKIQNDEKLSFYEYYFSKFCFSPTSFASFLIKQFKKEDKI